MAMIDTYRLASHGRIQNKLGRCEAGFTYAEVLVAVVILAVALLGLISALSTGIRTASVAGHQHLATILAQSKLDEIISARDRSGESDSGDFSPDHPEYAWQYQLDGPDQDGLYRIEVIVSWREQGIDRQQQLISYHPLGAGVSTNPPIGSSSDGNE